MPKLRKPIRADIFGRYAQYVEVEYMTKGRAKRKLRLAGCGPLKDDGRELTMVEPRDVWGRAYLIPGRGWVVHLSKK